MIKRPIIVLVPVLFVLVILVALTGYSRESNGDNTASWAGTQTCISSGCHADYRNTIYHGADEFFQTMHATAHSVPSPGSMLIDSWFRADSVLRLYPYNLNGSLEDTLLIALRYNEANATYAAQLRISGAQPDSTEWLDIIWAFGGHGWLQRYIVEIEGSRYVLPFQYVLPRYRDRWGDGLIRFRDVENWITHDTVINRIHLREFRDQQFVSGSWDNACVGCHVGSFSLEKNDIPGEPTRWVASWPGSDSGSASTELTPVIGCESCHGPGSAHVADPENPEEYRKISPKFWDPSGRSREWTDRKLDMCNQCHNRHHSTQDLHPYAYDDARQLTFQSGEDLSDYIRDPLSDGKYWGDGRSSRAHHQTGQDYIRSKHYTEHVFTNGCYDCHAVHNNTDQPYMLNRDWYTVERGEGCTSTGCHSSFAKTERRNGQEYNLHTAHRQEHSQCVNCHYTKTASFGQTGHFEFSDHSDQVLGPKATIEFRNASREGMPNTCALSCHRNGYGDRNRPDAFFDVIPGEAMRAPDFGINDTNLMLWNEPTDIALADSLWNGFKRLYPQFVSGVRLNDPPEYRAGILSVGPNPVRDEARIVFHLPEPAHVRIVVYNLQGKTLKTLADAYHASGSYELRWNCTDETRRLVPPGAYLVQLISQNYSESAWLMVQ